MKVQLRLWLLLGALLRISHCEVEVHAAPSALEDSLVHNGLPDGELEVDESHDGPRADEGIDPADMVDLVDPGPPPEEHDDEMDPIETLDADAQIDEDNTDFEALTSEQARGLHKKMDVNKNGKVSLAEMSDFATAMRRAEANLELDEVMRTKDLDEDKKLSLEEFTKPDPTFPEMTKTEAEFKELDKNNDGFIDHNELTSMYHHHINDEVETKLAEVAFKDKDLDKNGVVSLQEFYLHLQIEGEPPVDIEEEDKAVFKQLDTDGSGTLSLKELKAWESGSFQAEQAVAKIFQHADKDRDNVITEDELDTAREEIANHEDIDGQMYLMQWVANHDEL